MYRFLFTATVFGLSWSLALAQADVPDSSKNRPPVAAPTSQISVTPIEVVRSMSETINDFGGGLLQGLLAGHHIDHAGLVAAQDNRVIVTRDFGCCADFGEVFYSDFLAPLAVLQLAERQRVKLDSKVADVVDGYKATDVTVADVLIQRADPAALRRIVEASSGQDFRGYVSENILEPLAMGGSGEAVPFAQMVGRLLVALLNDGAVESGRLFAPETVALMRQVRFSIHPALPGWTYGFAEMRRNGWRALERDGAWLTTPGVEARMVLVPDARLAYFAIVEGHPGGAFWRMFDDSLFDRILPQGSSAAVEIPPTAAPDAAQAAALAGTYETSDEPLATAAPLKSAAERLVVRAGNDGSLHLSGAENAVLMPQPGGYWAAEGGSLSAVANDGRIVLSTGLYRPLGWWKRPMLYAALTVLFAFGTAGAFLGVRRKQGSGKPRSVLVTALAGVVAALLAVTLFVWHLTPVL